MKTKKSVFLLLVLIIIPLLIAAVNIRFVETDNSKENFLGLELSSTQQSYKACIIYIVTDGSYDINDAYDQTKKAVDQIKKDVPEIRFIIIKSSAKWDTSNVPKKNGKYLYSSDALADLKNDFKSYSWLTDTSTAKKKLIGFTYRMTNNGIALQPGKYSVVAHKPTLNKANWRDYTVIKHELGHNFGCPHCGHHCVMRYITAYIMPNHCYCESCENIIRNHFL